MGLNSRKKSMAARVCALAKSQRSHQMDFTVTSDQQPLHRVAKTWSRCKFRTLVCSNAGYVRIKVDQWLLRRSYRGKYLSCSATHATVFFFHEYGRRVGMVPKSSLKGGKNSLMVEKRTKTPNTTQTKQPKQNTTTQDPQAESPPSCSLSSVQGETCETSESVQKEA